MKDWFVHRFRWWMGKAYCWACFAVWRCCESGASLAPFELARESPGSLLVIAFPSDHNVSPKLL